MDYGVHSTARHADVPVGRPDIELYDLVVAINARITSGSDPALDMLFGTILPAMR